jgi:hypothetical protein
MADYVERVLLASRPSRLFINVMWTNGLIDDTWPETDLEQIYRLRESI